MGGLFFDFESIRTRFEKCSAQVEELMLDKRFVPEPFLPQLAMERAAEAKRKARQAEEEMARLGSGARAQARRRRRGASRRRAAESSRRIGGTRKESASEASTFARVGRARHSLGRQEEDC